MVIPCTSYRAAGKYKALFMQAVQEYGRNGGRNPLILHLGTRRRRVISFTFRSLYAHSHLAEGLRHFGRFGEEKYLVPLPVMEPRTVRAATSRYPAYVLVLVIYWLYGNKKRLPAERSLCGMTLCVLTSVALRWHRNL